MAIKDWKKIEDSPQVIIWYNRIGKYFPDASVHIYKEKYRGDNWHFSTTVESLSHKGFKTKSEALTYAKNYMKEH